MVVHRREGGRAREGARLRPREAARARRRRARISSGGQVIGTPYYMAPEQVRGEDLDARADIYSLGATLYRVLTGEPPFDAPSPMSVLSKHLTDDVVPPRIARRRALPPDADRIVLRAMAKSAEDRYASAAEVQQDFERALRRERRAASLLPCCRGRRCALAGAALRAARRPPPRRRRAARVRRPRDADIGRGVGRSRPLVAASDVDDDEWSAAPPAVDYDDWSLPHRRCAAWVRGQLALIATRVP